MPTDFTQAKRDYRTPARALTEHMAHYGYEIIEVPVIQPAHIFLTKAGDKIINRLFTFQRRGQELALRPEFTAVAAYRYLAENYKSVVRWQFSGPVFEESPDSHKDAYQYYSVGAELIGLGGCLAEAEIIMMAWEGCRKLGLDNATIVLGHTGLMRHLLGRFGLDDLTNRFLLTHRHELKAEGRGKSFILELIQTVIPPKSETSLVRYKEDSALPTRKMLDVLLDSTRRGDTMGGRSRADIAQRLLNKYERAHEFDQVLKALDFLELWVNLRGNTHTVFEQLQALVEPDDAIARQLLSDWSYLAQLLEQHPLNFQQIIIEPNLARDWDYYTGVVFGIQTAAGDFVVGGGRYDDLIRHLGGSTAVPAVGFAYYMRALLDNSPNTTAPLQTIALRCDLSNYQAAVQWAQRLRQSGLAIIIVNDSDAPMPTITVIDTATVQYQDETFQLEHSEHLISRLKG